MLIAVLSLTYHIFPQSLLDLLVRKERYVISASV